MEMCDIYKAVVDLGKWKPREGDFGLCYFISDFTNLALNAELYDQNKCS